MRNSYRSQQTSAEDVQQLVMWHYPCPYPPVQLQSISGVLISEQGEANVVIDLGDGKRRATALVAPINEICVLRLNFLRQQKCPIVLARHSIQVSNNFGMDKNKV